MLPGICLNLCLIICTNSNFFLTRTKSLCRSPEQHTRINFCYKTGIMFYFKAEILASNNLNVSNLNLGLTQLSNCTPSINSFSLPNFDCPTTTIELPFWSKLAHSFCIILFTVVIWFVRHSSPLIYESKGSTCMAYIPSQNCMELISGKNKWICISEGQYSYLFSQK